MELKDIKELIRFIDKTDVKEFEYETENGERIYISKKDEAPVFAQAPFSAPAYAPAPAAPASAPAAAAECKDSSSLKGNQIEIKTPIVGTFYESSTPGGEPFVKEGSTVKKGQTLCIVEAMKIMNEIEAEFDCKIVRKIGQNARPVEYGETIFIAEPM